MPTNRAESPVVMVNSEEEVLKMLKLFEVLPCVLVKSFKHLRDVTSLRHRDEQSLQISWEEIGWELNVSWIAVEVSARPV